MKLNKHQIDIITQPVTLVENHTQFTFNTVINQVGDIAADPFGRQGSMAVTVIDHYGQKQGKHLVYSNDELGKIGHTSEIDMRRMLRMRQNLIDSLLSEIPTEEQAYEL